MRELGCGLAGWCLQVRRRPLNKELTVPQSEQQADVYPSPSSYSASGPGRHPAANDPKSNGNNVSPTQLGEREVIDQWAQVADWTPEDRRRLTFLLGVGSNTRTIDELRSKTIGQLLDGYTAWLEGRRVGLLSHTPEGRDILRRSVHEFAHNLRPIWMLLNLIGGGRDRPDQPSASAMTLAEAVNAINSVRQMCGSWLVIPVTYEEIVNRPQRCIATELRTYRTRIDDSIREIGATRFMCDGQRPGNYTSSDPTVNSAAIEAYRILERANDICDESIRQTGQLDMVRPDPNQPIPLNDDQLLGYLRELWDWSIRAWAKFEGDSEQRPNRNTIEVAGLMDVERTKPESTTISDANKAKPRRATKGKAINAQMLKVLDQKPESRNWSAQQWADHLGCAKSTVGTCQVWKNTLATVRVIREVDRAEKRDRRRV